MCIRRNISKFEVDYQIVLKKIIFLIFVLYSTGSFSQNWQPVNPAYRCNYQTDTSAFISNTILVDSVKVENGDSVFYLNRVAVAVMNQSWDYYAMTNLPQFLQRKMIKESNGFYHFYDTLSFCINPFATINDTWLYDTLNSITATLFQQGIDSLFGILDSVKYIYLSTGDTIILSKNYGIVRFPNGYGQNHFYELKGVEGPDVGEQVPGFWEFFDFNVGDELQYESGSWAMCAQDHYSFKHKIVSKNISGDTITYYTEKFLTGLYYNSCMSPPEWDFYSFHGPSMLQFINSKTDLFNACNNQIVSINNYGLSSSFTGSGCINPYTETNIYVIQKLKNDQNGLIKECYQAQYLCNDTSDLYYVCSGETVLITFVEGLGEVNHQIMGFEWSLGESLVGYVKNGDTVGNLTPDSLWLYTNQNNSSKTVISIYPNPASGILYLESHEQWAVAEIIDLNGKVVKRAEGNEIDISDLRNGLYAIRIHTTKGVVTRKFVKE